jgi:acetoin utilization protein AcuB
MHGTVRAALCTDVVTIGPDAPLSAAEPLFVERRTPEVYVTSPCGLLLGILPDYEVLKMRLLGTLANAGRVADVMVTRVEAATLDTPLGEVACRLRVNVHSRMPVIDEGRLIGYVSRRELFAVLLAAEVDGESSRAATEINPEFRRHVPRAPMFLHNARLVSSEPGM